MAEPARQFPYDPEAFKKTERPGLRIAGRDEIPAPSQAFKPDESSGVYDPEPSEGSRPNLHAVRDAEDSAGSSSDRSSQPLASITNIADARRKREAKKADEASPDGGRTSKETGDDSPGRFGFGFKVGTGLYRKEGNEADGEDKPSGLRGKAKKFAKSHKKLLFGGALGGIGLLAGIGIFLFIIGTLLIPNFATHITEYQFARLARTFSEDANQITNEKLAVDAAANAADKTTYQRILDSFNNKYNTLRDNTWGKFDPYRPKIVMKNLQTEGRLKFDENVGVLGRRTTTGVTFDGVSYELTGTKFFDQFHPIENFKGNVQLAADFSTAFNAGLRDDTGILIRGLVENQIRKELGISLFAWSVGKYQGKSQADAEAQIEQDAFVKIEDPSAVGSTGVSSLDQAAQDTVNAEKKCVEDPECLKQIVDNGGAEPVAAVTAIENGVTAAGFGNAALKALGGPVVTIGIPLCMIYSGSLQKSGPAIDAKSTEAQRTYFLIASAADQQKSGTGATAEAVGAMNWKIGDPSQSNPEIRASGGMVDTTTNQLSPQAGATGQFTIFDALLGGVFSGALDTAANIGCPIITSPGFIVGSIFAGPIIAALTDGSSEAFATGVGDIVSGFVNQFTTKEGLKTFFGSTLKVGGAIVAGTLLAKILVANSAGSQSNGLAVGTSFDNTGDQGGNFNSNVDMQQQFKGIPMTNAQTAQSDATDNSFLLAKAASKSTFQRYFALSNADSLLTRLGTTMLGSMNHSIFSSLLSSTSKLFSPLVMLPKLFSSLNTKAAFAAGATDNQHYGIVQWGWTPEEKSLINSNPSYQPLENAKVFTDEANAYSSTHNGADLEADIKTAVGECFTSSMGTLLSQQKIVRNAHGDVVPDQGQCSPNNLSFQNNFGGEPQSIFRWRLMQYYNAGMDQLTQVQNAGSNS